jgi:hypothetical protein
MRRDLPSSFRSLLMSAAGIIAALLCPSETDGSILDALLQRLPPPYRSVVEHPDRYNLQIIYTQIDRDVRNRPHFNHFLYRVNPKEYFYPASLVKLPVAALALEKINTLGIRGLSRRTPLQIDNTIDCPAGYLWSDTSSVESSIRRMLLASDNGAYNRLWEFLTRDYANSRLKECGYGGIRLLHRLSACSVLQNRVNNPVRFCTENGKTLYAQPRTVSRLSDDNPLAPVTMGSFSYFNGMLMLRPFRADNLNYAPLESVHRFLIAVMFPVAAGSGSPLRLSAGDYHLLRTWMCLLPRESGMPEYVPDSGYADNFKKYLLFGDSTQPCVPYLREFNVVGRAYGFLSDVAYFADFKARVEFFLSAVISVNEDGIINDDQYEYKTIALPFFSALGTAVYGYEKTRYRHHRPDLREFIPAMVSKKAFGSRDLPVLHKR